MNFDNCTQVRNSVFMVIGLFFVAIFGVLWGVMTLGSVALDSNNLQWLWGDLAQVYIAWSQYLSDANVSWLSTSRISYPLPISVSLFDPMPLLLIVVRLFSGLIQEGKQFFGYYFVLCLMLQGIFGYLAALKGLALVRAKDISMVNDLSTYYIAVVVGVFFASLPFTMYRFQGHTALSSQWVLALSIWVTLATLATGRKKWVIFNGLVAVAATGLNPYLALMVLGSNSVVLISRWRFYGAMEVFIRGACLVLIVFLSLWFFGFIGAAGTATGGYGIYSMNILGPFDSNGKAGLLPLNVADATGGQSFEGYTYLGLGLLILFALALLAFVNYRISSGEFLFVPVLSVVLCFYLLALSTTVTLSTHVWQLPLPDILTYPLSKFRGSGRFFWMSGFWLVILATVAIVLRFGVKKSALLLTVAVAIQLIDVRPISLDIRDTIASFSALRLQGVDVAEASSILVYPPWQCDHQGTPGGIRNYEFVGYLAARNQIPTNNFYAARTPAEQSAYHCDYEQRLATIDYQAIYLLSVDMFNEHEDAFQEYFNCNLEPAYDGVYTEFWICSPLHSQIER